jgi:hypothetical protein
MDVSSVIHELDDMDMIKFREEGKKAFKSRVKDVLNDPDWTGGFVLIMDGTQDCSITTRGDINMMLNGLRNYIFSCGEMISRIGILEEVAGNTGVMAVYVLRHVLDDIMKEVEERNNDRGKG